MIEVPFLSPKLSSHWVRFVTRGQLGQKPRPLHEKATSRSRPQLQ